MAINVGSATAKAPQTPPQPLKANNQVGKDSKDAGAKADLAPAIKQAAQLAAGPAAATQAATQAATKAIGALVNTKA